MENTLTIGGDEIPLVGPKDDPEETDTVEKPVQERKKKITASLS